MNIDDLTVKQLREIAAVASLLGGVETPKETAGKDHGICILAADRGWVFVGQVTEYPSHFEMKDSKTIIYWGTTTGLEEIADGGPTVKTRLASSVSLRHVPREAVKQLMTCNPKNWK